MLHRKRTPSIALLTNSPIGDPVKSLPHEIVARYHYDKLATRELTGQRFIRAPWTTPLEASGNVSDVIPERGVSANHERRSTPVSLAYRLAPGTPMPPTKSDYSIASFGRKRRYTVHPSPSGGVHLPVPQDPRGCASCCPAFLLILIGSWLCVLGVVFTDRPTVQPLTPLLWLGHVHARRQQYQEVTKLFVALLMGISELEVFYSGADFNVVSEA